MPGLFKVVCLLYTCFGPVLSSNTSALEPSPTLSASYAMVSGNADVSASQASGFASRTRDVTPIPSSSLVSAQSSLGQPDDGDNVFQQAAKKLEDKLEPNVEELNGKIHKEIDPTRSEPRDVTVIDMLAKMMEQTQNILTEFNNTGNATGDFFNATKGLGFVLVIEKLDCHKERSTAIPDRSDKETSRTLAKFSDYVTLKFDCPWIVINATRSKSTNLRKREDGAEEDENDDFHEFQMLHHPSSHNCSHFLTSGGNITTPSFPDNYPNNVICTWVLQAPVNHTVKLLIEEFYLEKDKKCFYDFMEFFDGGNAIEDLQMNKRFCGKQRPFIDYESTGRNLTIQFTSDKDKTYKGFLAVWETKKIVTEYVQQHVAALVMIYSPTVNDTHYPLGTATTCSPGSRTIDNECVFEDKVFIISRLMIAQMDRSLPLDGDNRIVLHFEHIMHEKLFPTIYNGEKICVSWNKEAKNEPTDDSDHKLQPKGGWTRSGCSVAKTNLTHTSCACNKKGLFAVVGKEKVESQKLKLLANTYIGIGISFFILILAIVHIAWKVEIHGGEVMRINMCAAIIVMQCVFLIGAHVKAQQTLCGFLAFTVYLSVLAEFCWLLLHGLRIHGKIKRIFASNLNIEIVYVVIGWGLPTLLALIAIGVQIDLKNPDDVCWEAATGSAMWGYAGPVIIIALFNMAVLLKLLIPTEDVRNNYDYEQMRFRVIKDAIFLAFFGLTCTFAYQAVEKERFTEQYVLTTFVVLQAIAMFVFGREGRKDFVKQAEKAKPDASTAEIQPAATEEPENIYETIEDVKPGTDLGEGQMKRPRKRNAGNKQPEKITVSTLKNLNIYKEGGQYVIEA
ncbi:uncharacterized protein LOC111332821 [Stylophora pistillata]|uniref:uncharacterized protein LOC111332821 n=1 Tax=Stylophora pistillata TaxID=50429 RepID=UPI000C03F88A|nr:uncharacterized protein LOC111332821 [Stylophora pistillata]